MTEPSIRPVDPSDAAALIAWNDVARRAYADGRDAVWFRSPEATVALFADPKPGRRSILLGAWLGDDLVGVAEANADPEQPVDVEIGVLPSHRKRGSEPSSRAASLSCWESAPRWCRPRRTPTTACGSPSAVASPRRPGSCA